LALNRIALVLWAKNAWKTPLIRARLSLGLVAPFLALLGTLAFLEPAFNSGHLISEYQLGNKGWMMSVAFCFGMGAMLLAHVIPPLLSTRGGRLGRRGLWLIGLALSISNRLMIATYCLWFVIAAWGPARRAS
jgi:hypothetical protein